MAKTIYTLAGVPVQYANEPIAASGGEGTVYKIENHNIYSKHCIKIYHPKKRTAQKRQKIEFMVKNKPNRLIADNYVICWPIEIVFEKNGDFVGFIMPLAIRGSESLYDLTRHQFKNGISNASIDKYDRGNVSGIKKRLMICVNISIAVYVIHENKKYTIVDYKPQNILISSDGAISIIDVDSFQIAINKQVLFHADVVTPEYEPPESSRVNPSKEFVSQSWDGFSLAVSFYEILFGIHPYAATSTGQYQAVTTIGEKIQKGLFVHGSKQNYLSVIPAPHNNFNNLPSNIKELFIRAFENGHTDDKARPTPEEWGQVIYKELMVGANIKPHSIQVKKNVKPIIVSAQNHAHQNNIANNQKLQKKDYKIAKKLAVTAIIILIFILLIYL